MKKSTGVKVAVGVCGVGAMYLLTDQRSRKKAYKKGMKIAKETNKVLDII